MIKLTAKIIALTLITVAVLTVIVCLAMIGVRCIQEGVLIQQILGGVLLVLCAVGLAGLAVTIKDFL